MTPRLDRAPQAARLAAYALAVAVLLYLCLAPADELPRQRMWDKGEHSLAWLVLAGLGLAFWPQRPRTLALFALAVGVLVELLQATMGFGRSGDWRDLLADSIGVGLALVGWAAVRRRLEAT